jgi:hypothetical protein
MRRPIARSSRLESKQNFGERPPCKRIRTHYSAFELPHEKPPKARPKISVLLRDVDVATAANMGAIRLIRRYRFRSRAGVCELSQRDKREDNAAAIVRDLFHAISEAAHESRCRSSKPHQ